MKPSDIIQHKVNKRLYIVDSVDAENDTIKMREIKKFTAYAPGPGIEFVLSLVDDFFEVVFPADEAEQPAAEA